MSHEPKSPSLGMISTATRTTATVSPLTPSPLNGSIVANGSPATQSAHSGFAAALRKLAKQAEEPRGKATQPGTPRSQAVHSQASQVNGDSLSSRSDPKAEVCKGFHMGLKHLGRLTDCGLESVVVEDTPATPFQFLCRFFTFIII